MLSSSFSKNRRRKYSLFSTQGFMLPMNRQLNKLHDKTLRNQISVMISLITFFYSVIFQNYYWSIYLSEYLPIYLSVYLYVYLPIYSEEKIFASVSYNNDNNRDFVKILTKRE